MNRSPKLGLVATALAGLCACGGAGDAPTPAPEAAAGPVSVTVSPPSASTGTGGTARFTATVTGSADTGVNWSVEESGGGTVDASGLYTAPATAATYHVVATSRADPTRSNAATVVVSATTPGGTGKWVTGYWAAWTAGNMLPYPYTAIDWTALTHVTVAFAYPGAGATVGYRGGNLGSTLARQVTAAAHANGKKAILMVGGVGSAADLAAATNYGASSPQTFVDNLYALAHGDGFDGIDIDWEGLWSSDYANFKKLATGLRAKWPDMILTCAIGWDQTGNSFFGTLKDAGGNWLFDQLNVMTYDAANAWPGWVSWFHNALDDAASNRPSSVAAALGKLATTGGVPKERIGMGIPFYGSAWWGGTTPVTGPRQAISSGASATQGQDTVWTYKFILDNYYQPYDPVAQVGYVFDAAAGVPYITGGAGGTSRNGKQKVTFLSYDDPASIAAKGNWIKANGYGGTIIWLINEGAVDAAGTNPLLTAVKAAFLQ